MTNEETRPEDGEQIHYDGQNVEEVKAFLGSHLDKVRGDLNGDDRLVVWFHEEIAPKDVLRQAFPGDWLVRSDRGTKKAVVVIPDESYQFLVGLRDESS